ncbi:CPBP family intramembrane glutamic endopeptidase [Metabacillus malikii]|uniref:Membrane protease YdiL (CAAX protease family) n=1 Tax=Metabacillus malikii TaxID=1504265 RepID=A0ABT9ZEW6_9BACI|nr:type II CAAX endopeptidase family protein [Metabacillus malikii]MDQ0230774.1 membrane protease YdiL (CAAX protease family) [Metabacillus malikii]
MNNKVNLLLGCLFFIGILFISYSLFWGLSPVLLVFIYFYLKGTNRKLLVVYSAFLIGFTGFQVSATTFAQLVDNKQLIVLANRLCLLFVVISLVSISRFFKEPFQYHKRPKWDAKIFFPFIWRGFHSIDVKYFLLTAILINIIIFIPIIAIQDGEYTNQFFLFAISFAILNATLEEFIWRGYFLSQLKESVNEYYAVIFTSIGFGLQHIAIGIPLIPSLLFTFGGLFFAGVVVRSNSIYPSIFWHILLNLGMVYSGFILS